MTAFMNIQIIPVDDTIMRQSTKVFCNYISKSYVIDSTNFDTTQVFLRLSDKLVVKSIFEIYVSVFLTLKLYV